jgi:CDP-glucose 4,6-dehydratase
LDISFFKGKKVFVTGHTGFKGSWLCRILVYAGANVTGYALAPSDEPNLYDLTGTKKYMKPVIADIRDGRALSRAIKAAKPEIVFHLAAQPLVRESYKDPVYTYGTNVLGTVNLLEACRYQRSIRSVVNVTTDKVYENKEHDRGYREDENLCGFDPYSNSKSCSELVTAAYRNSFYSAKGSASLSTARSGNVIGGGDFAKDRLIPDCVRAIKAGKTMVVRNPHATRPYQHVLDCLSGYLLLARKQYDRKLSGSYNFGPDAKDTANNAALVDMFFKAWGSGKIAHRRDNGPHEAHFLKLDCAKAKKKLGWKPQIPLKKAVRLTVEWNSAYLAKGDFTGCMDGQITDYFVKG